MKTRETGANSKAHEKEYRAAYWAWGLIAVFFFYQYFVRLAPGLLIDDLRKEFNLTANEFSAFGTYYLYVYSLLQIPLGLILDKIGVRRMILGSLVVFTVGGVMAGLAEHLWLALLSRALVGAGSGAVMISAIKVVVDRLSPGKRGFLMGMTLTMGTLGAVTAGMSIVPLRNSFGWRDTLVMIGSLGVVLMVIGFIVLPRRDKGRRTLVQTSWKEVGQGLLGVVKNRHILLYAFLAVGLYTPLSVLADLWGKAFLMEKYKLIDVDAARTITMLYLGLAVGSIVLPGLCERYNMLNRAIRVCSVGIFITFALVLYGPVISGFQLTILLVTLGFFCGAEMMCFAGAALYTNRDNSGLTLGFVNTLNMLGGAILQKVIGYGLDMRWSGHYNVNGIRAYDTEEFVFVLSVLLIVVGTCCVVSLKLKNHVKVEK